jgi:hypothetical protein
MASLGIFGDSFADPGGGHGDQHKMTLDAWMFQLPLKYNPYVYARGGSGIYFSYKQFMDKHHKHDRIIFLATNPERIWNTNLKHPDGGDMFVPSYEQAEYYLRTKHLSHIEIKTLEAIQAYYLYIADRQVHLDISQVLLDKVKQTRPDTLFIPVFHGPDAKGHYRDMQGPAVIAYLDTMIRSLTGEKDLPNAHRKVMGRLERRCICHLSKEVNQVLGRDVGIALETNIWNPTVPDFVNHDITDLDYYYTDDYLPGLEQKS